VRASREARTGHKIARAVRTASSAKSGATQTGVRWDGRLEPLAVDCPLRRCRVGRSGG
jgi:hypothetical protein